MNISSCAFIVVAFLVIGTHEVLGSEGLPYQCGEKNCTTQSPPGGDITDIISSEIFEELLPKRNSLNPCGVASGFYTYDAFVDAARSFTGFGTTGNMDIRKREVAAYFAQTAATTTEYGFPRIEDKFEYGYCYKRTWGNPATFDSYCDPDVTEWPCAPGKKYYGRGPFLITGNSVYGPCGAAIGEDLINNPDLVETDPVISFKSAIYLWMTPKPMSPSCHDVMVGNWQPTPSDIAANRIPGYGVVTNILYSGLMCGKGGYPFETLRWAFYLFFCQMLGVTDRWDNLSCENQIPFSGQPSYADA